MAALALAADRAARQPVRASALKIRHFQHEAAGHVVHRRRIVQSGRIEGGGGHGPLAQRGAEGANGVSGSDNPAFDARRRENALERERRAGAVTRGSGRRLAIAKGAAVGLRQRIREAEGRLRRGEPGESEHGSGDQGIRNGSHM
ncbi:hypothetical protein [Gemmatimonas sp.]|uniref:hypothetical protein n=1 Tax=Gemmatimonas sp. TaxID=1962908 RepID=UPI003DA61643